ncbi:hypothetical protein D3C85_1508260 [compost metagenome]
MVLKNTVYIHPRAPTKDRQDFPYPQFFKDPIEILFELVHIVFFSCRPDIDQVIRNLFTIDPVFFKIFSGTNVHISKYLSAVGTDQFSL